MFLNRVWAMPNSNTFDIKPIRDVVLKYIKRNTESIDPFANVSKIAKFRNDINPEYGTEYCMDALDFMKIFKEDSVDVALYDPPYSLRQVSECYKNHGYEVTMETTQSSWRSKHMDELARIVKPQGYVLSFGWNTNGVGKTRGFEIVEILLVAHGGSHNDTIVTVEQKSKTLFD